MKRFSPTSLSVALVLCLARALPLPAATTAERPNIRRTTCEDISPNHGCYGDTFASTPNLDRLAELEAGTVLDLIVNAAKQLEQLVPLTCFESGGATFKRMEWKVDGVTREALVRFPATAGEQSAPLLFVWHGFGGTMRAAVSSLPLHADWPEAIVVFPQGLLVARAPQGVAATKFGWQLEPGEFGDRDVKFFDAMLDTFLGEHHADGKHVFSAGHSNGGRFTQILWAERGDKLAAVATAGTFIEGWLDRLTPKPCLHLAGENDTAVPFAKQQRTVEALRIINGCDADAEPWLKLSPGKTARYPSSKDAPLVSVTHPGGHEFPSRAAELMVSFFKVCVP